MIPPLVLGFSQVFHEAKKLFKTPTATNETTIPKDNNEFPYFNFTRSFSQYLTTISPSADFNATLKAVRSEAVAVGSEARTAEEVVEDYGHGNVTVYIVVVLFFYSFGIGIIMMKYMQKKEKEQEKYPTNQRYIKESEHDQSKPTNNERLSNRLALQALNMANSIPQTSHTYSKVTYV